jgi:hypothetical protein
VAYPACEGKNPKCVGEITEAMALAILLREGETVLVPHGDNQRYDLALDRDGMLVRVQVKTGRLVAGSVRFPTCSLTGGRRDYRGEIELFADYCPDNDQLYLVPVEDLGISRASLRVEPT